MGQWRCKAFSVLFLPQNSRIEYSPLIQLGQIANSNSLHSNNTKYAFNHYQSSWLESWKLTQTLRIRYFKLTPRLSGLRWKSPHVKSFNVSPTILKFSKFLKFWQFLVEFEVDRMSPHESTKNGRKGAHGLNWKKIRLSWSHPIFIN